MLRTLGMLVVALGLGWSSLGCQKAGPTGTSSFSNSPGVEAESSRLATRGDFGGPPPPRAAELDDAPMATSPSRDFGEELAPRHEKPGLGTSYGEQRFSSVTDAPFRRASNVPDVELALFYNDLEGVRSAAGHLAGGRARADLESRVTSHDGLVAMSLVDDGGRSFAAAQVDGRRYAIGNDGEAYRIGVENHSSGRLEVVASVDGLDVIDGDDAGFHKRGYIVEPFSSVVIDGWRTSGDTVAAFRFSGIADSYADRTGRPRNVGVIGAAFFRERGEVHFHDVHRRHDSDPFPGRFAPPPPSRRWR
jgi:hypothetical protein